MAIYIINILSSSVLKWKTSYEVLHKKQPDYSVLKTFGCLCCTTNTHPQKTKFKAQALKSIFLGYEIGFKAYKLHDISNKKLFMLRDVIFHEHVYPYQSQPPQTDHHNTLLPIPNLIILDDNEDQRHNRREITLPEPRFQEPAI